VTARHDGAPAGTSPPAGSAVSAPGRICAATQTYARDLPPGCLCLWAWSERLGKYIRETPFPGCPQHEGDQL
jgi:hypothetical protein